MSQNTEASYDGIDVAVAGAKYDIAPDTVRSRAAEGVVPFGRAVKLGTSLDKQCELVDAAADDFYGVALQTHTITVQEGGTPQYDDTDTVSILTQGGVYVEVTSDVDAGAAAYVDVASGKFTDVATDNLAVPGGSFETTATSGGLAVLTIK